MASAEHDAQNQRLDRIESKIDQLSDAMIQLARAEEKLSNIESNTQNQYERLNRHSEKIDQLDDEIKTTKTRQEFLVRFMWICITAVVGTLGTHFIF